MSFVKNWDFVQLYELLYFWNNLPELENIRITLKKDCNTDRNIRCFLAVLRGRSGNVFLSGYSWYTCFKTVIAFVRNKSLLCNDLLRKVHLNIAMLSQIWPGHKNKKLEFTIKTAARDTSSCCNVSFVWIFSNHTDDVKKYLDVCNSNLMFITLCQNDCLLCKIG